MKWTNSYRSFGLKTKRSTGLKTIEHKHNNKIKVTIRMAYGFRDTDNLIAMIKLRCSGLPIHLPAPIP